MERYKFVGDAEDLENFKGLGYGDFVADKGGEYIRPSLQAGR